MPKTKYVILPNLGETTLEILINEATELRKHHWTFRWTCRPALIDKSSGSAREYIGQKKETKQRTLTLKDLIVQTFGFANTAIIPL